MRIICREMSASDPKVFISLAFTGAFKLLNVDFINNCPTATENPDISSALKRVHVRSITDLK